jgi:tetratricopeptide (TPR) repeat protein
MKHLIILVLTILSFTSCAQQANYSNWKEEAKSNIRLLPKYGNAIKTKEQKAADEELIRSYLKQEGTHRKASELLVKLGFDYLYKSDIKTAMYRFNQAWLLDPKNENAFWGFAAIYFTFGDFDAALKQHEEGLLLNPASSNILTDKATVYLTRHYSSSKKEDLDLAIQLFKQSYAITPTNQNTLFKLSVAYFVSQDCANAWKYYNECKKLGGDPITAEYTDALNKNCKK